MRRFLWVVLLLLGGGLLTAAWYAYDKGFTKKWRAAVTGELRKRGFEVTLRRMTLEPWRGIVAKEVKLYDARDRKRLLGVVDELHLVINFADFFQGKPFLEALDLRDAQLELPIDPRNPRGPRIEINKLSGRLMLPPRQLYLRGLEADLYGIHLSASGRLIHPEELQTRTQASALMPLSIIEKILAELKATRFESTPPQLDIRFSGDVKAPEQLFVEATFWAQKIRRADCRLENVYFAAVYRDAQLTLQHLVATDARGALRASGNYHPGTHEGALRLESNLDLQALAKSFHLAPELGEFVFYTPPRLNLTAQSERREQPSVRVLGQLQLGKFAFKSVVFEKFLTDFSWDGARWSVRDLQLVHRSGEITGDVMQLPGEFRSRLKNSVNPKALAPLLSGKLGEWFSRCNIVEPGADGTSASRGDSTRIPIARGNVHVSAGSGP